MKNLKSEKLYVQVFNEIRSYIVRNGLSVGDKLPTEHEMCETLGVSRNVLRESIKAMELMGIIKAMPGVGSVIQEFNMDYIFQYVFYYLVADDNKLIEEVLEIRKNLELSYMEKAFYAVTKEDCRELREIFEQLKQHWNNKEHCHDLDRQFHMILFRNLDNRTLNALFEATWNVDGNFKMGEKNKNLPQSINKHERIVEAIEARNPEAFKEAMNLHFNSGKFSNAEADDF